MKISKSEFEVVDFVSVFSFFLTSYLLSENADLKHLGAFVASIVFLLNRSLVLRRSYIVNFNNKPMVMSVWLKEGLDCEATIRLMLAYFKQVSDSSDVILMRSKVHKNVFKIKGREGVINKIRMAIEHGFYSIVLNGNEINFDKVMVECDDVDKKCESNISSVELSTKKVHYKTDVVCHGRKLVSNGKEIFVKEKELAEEYLPELTRNIKCAKVFVLYNWRGLFGSTNYIKDGHDFPAKIYYDGHMGLFQISLNLLLSDAEVNDYNGGDCSGCVSICEKLNYISQVEVFYALERSDKTKKSLEGIDIFNRMRSNVKNITSELNFDDLLVDF